MVCWMRSRRKSDPDSVQQWLASKLARLRHVTEKAADATSQESGKLRQSRRWTMLNATKARSPSSPVYLPMTSETAE